MRPKIDWSFVKGVVLTLIALTVMISGYWLVQNYDALYKTIKFPDAVRSMEVQEILIATYSGTLNK